MTFPKLLAAIALLLPAAAWGQATSTATGPAVKNGAVVLNTASGVPITFPVASSTQPGVTQLGTTTGTSADGGAVAAATAALAPVYLGEVATRARVPNSETTGSTQFMGRSFMVASDTLSALTVRFPFWWVNYQATSNEETATGSNGQVHGSVEYPVGTETEMTCNGVKGVVAVTDNTDAVCTVNVNIPNGAVFEIREWASMPSGIVFTNTLKSNNVWPDTMTFGNSVTDQTLGGTVVNSGGNTNVAVFPDAVLGMTRKNAACFVADSRVEGVADARQPGTLYGGELERYVGPRTAFINMGVAGDIATRAVQSFTHRQALLPYCKVMLNELGINDLYYNNETVAQAESARTSLDALFTGRVLGVTLAPVTSSTDNWTSAAGQSTLSYEPLRQQINTDIRSGLSGETGVVDIDTGIDPTQSHLWPTNGVASYYTTDGLHENTPAAMMELYSGIWNAVSLGY